MECPICLIEFKTFKILQCGHHYCKQCVEDLKRPATNSAKTNNRSSTMTNGHCGTDSDKTHCFGSDPEKSSLTSSVVCGDGSSGAPNNADPQLSLEDGFPCPQCRQITPFDSQLKTKVIGNLMCRQCDVVKSSEDFRWCFDCSLNLCNTCFMDKHVHVNQDGAIALHNGSRWDLGYPQAAYCVRRLMKDVDQCGELIKKNQEYLNSYLDGLKEYMCHEIDQKTKQTTWSHVQKISAICEAYSLNKQDIAKMFDNLNSIVNPDTTAKNYETVLDEILRLAEIQDDQELTQNEGKTIKLNCMPYKQMSNLLLSKKSVEVETTDASSTIQVNSAGYPVLEEVASTTTREEKLSKKRQKHALANGKLSKTTALALEAVQKPSDLCLLAEYDIMLITDFDNGLFAVKVDGDLSTLVPIPLKHQKFVHFSRLALMPRNSCGKLKSDLFTSLAAVNVQHGGNEWHFAVVGVTRSGGRAGDGHSFDLVTINNSSHWSLPSKENACLGSSREWTYALTGKALFRCHWPLDTKWKEVYGGSHAVQQFGRLGSIREIDQFDQKKNCQVVEIFLINELWKCLEILRFDENHGKILSVRRVELSGMFTDSSDFLACKQPFLADLATADDFERNLPRGMMVADKKSAFLYTWSYSDAEESGSAAEAEKIHEFGTKYPQKIVQTRSSVWFVFQHKENSNLRTIEFTGV